MNTDGKKIFSYWTPIAWCGKCGDGELDFLWVDYYPWEEDNDGDQAIIKAIEDEGVDYCALCWDCVSELKKKGAKHEY